MTDLSPIDSDHLSDEEFMALCPQGEHAPGPEPLSAAARAVLDAAIRVAESPDAEAIAAAALRAAADRVASSDLDKPRNYLPALLECQRIRAELLAIATELENHAN